MKYTLTLHLFSIRDLAVVPVQIRAYFINLVYNWLNR